MSFWKPRLNWRTETIVIRSVPATTPRSDLRRFEMVCVTVGRPECRELEVCREELERHVTVLECPTVPQARTQLAQAARVDWGILWQSRPGRLTEHHLAALRKVRPITRWVEVAGAWCEGEPASGRPLEGVVRVYWYEFPWRLAHACQRRQAGKCDLWSLPATATRTDRTLWTAGASSHPVCGISSALPPDPQPSSAATTTNTILVLADRWRDFESTAQWCRLAGWTPHFCRPSQWAPDKTMAAGVIWNRGSGALDDGPIRELGSLCRQPHLVLLDFPRADEIHSWQASGWDVAARPFSLADFSVWTARL